MKHCPYCDIKIELWEDPDKKIFQWHLDGHGKTKEETLSKQFVCREIKKAKSQRKCAACDGAKCEHTFGCQALADLLEVFNCEV